MSSTRSFAKHQAGQAYAETLVGFAVIGLFLLGAHHLWRHGELQQAAVDAVRFAAWERVVWEPVDNDAEKFALHKTDESLAKAAVLHQLSTPAAWRNFRAGLTSNGTPQPTSTADARNSLSMALKSFVSPGMDPNNLITVTTDSGWTNSVERKFRGMDPTFNTTTSLDLDKDTYRTVNLSLKSQLTPTTGLHFFDFLLPAIDTKKRLSLITNTWAGSLPMTLVRDRQLMPLSTGYEVSGTKPNVLAYFGLKNSSQTASAADFVGMVPMWNFIGGANGMAGQFVVREIGLDAAAANNLMQTGGQKYSFDPANPASSVLLKSQIQQSEYLNFNAALAWQHRNTQVIANTAEDAAEPGIKARNSNLEARKYRAVSLQNPAETYFIP